MNKPAKHENYIALLTPRCLYQICQTLNADGLKTIDAAICSLFFVPKRFVLVSQSSIIRPAIKKTSLLIGLLEMAHPWYPLISHCSKRWIIKTEYFFRDSEHGIPQEGSISRVVIN
eukprot:TRINITY_DN13091_c0_g1_i1.p1 TRINITY_DN13091_c0_g1~~TRINITY_DN13091_c0_g1_i1.p1  ORF type:complete len:131 (-),score=7.33 TRINITY_DN13091_c0_g1_i1:615-962(-)